jgi:hypothetical protein
VKEPKPGTLPEPMELTSTDLAFVAGGKATLSVKQTT